MMGVLLDAINEVFVVRAASRDQHFAFGERCDGLPDLLCDVFHKSGHGIGGVKGFEKLFLVSLKKLSSQRFWRRLMEEAVVVKASQQRFVDFAALGDQSVLVVGEAFVLGKPVEGLIGDADVVGNAPSIKLV